MWLNLQRHNNLDVPAFIRYGSRRVEGQNVLPEHPRHVMALPLNVQTVNQ